MKKKNYIIFFLVEGKLVEQFSYASRYAFSKRLRTLWLDEVTRGHRVFYYNAQHSLWFEVFEDVEEEVLWRSRMVKGSELYELKKGLSSVQGFTV